MKGDLWKIYGQSTSLFINVVLLLLWKKNKKGKCNNNYYSMHAHIWAPSNKQFTRENNKKTDFSFDVIQV